MKYVIIIFSLILYFACGPAEKNNSTKSQNNSNPTEQVSKKTGGNNAKKKVKKAGPKLAKRYQNIVDKSILNEDQAKRLQKIDREFFTKRKELVKNKKWSGKQNASNRKKFHLEKSAVIKSEFGEETAKKLNEYLRSLNKAK